MSAHQASHASGNDIELTPHGVSAASSPAQNLRGSGDVPHQAGLRGPEPSLGLENDVSVIAAGDFKRTNLTIGYRDVSVTVRVAQKSAGYETMITPAIDAYNVVATLGESLRKRDFHRIDKVSGVLRPGQMTLILAPPGHGKSTFLKAMSSRILTTEGSIVYNGLTAQEAAEEGCNTRRLTQYVDQIDEHMPMLTVTETLDFAHRVTCSHYDPARVENTIRLLGLEECKDTILGNALVRGVSGGQKRRVTLGEMLVGDACALFLDEYTNGLDTATSEDITRGLRRWVEQTNGMIVTSLQQPTPGLFAMFDNIIVLRDAQIVYDGPRADLESYLASMGFVCPSDVDVCDFVIDSMSQPRVVIDRQAQNAQAMARASAKKGHAIDAPAQSWPVEGGELRRAKAPCVTTAQMVAHYKASPMWARNGVDLEKACPVAATTSAHDRPHEPLMPSPEAADMYRVGYTLPFFTLFGIIMRRQWTNMKRNKDQLIARFGQALLMGLLYGSLYYDIQPDNFYLRIAVLLISQTQVGFGSMVELATSVENNLIVFKQSGASFYPTYMYVLSAAVTAIPVFFCEAAILSFLLYFMSNCVREAGVFLTFYCIVLLTCFMMSIWFRMLSALVRDEPAAHAIAGPSTGIFIIFGGFLVTMENLPVWMRWIMWISPFSWSVRSLANNEFLSSRYDSLTDDGVRLGNMYLDTVDMKVGKEWIGYGALYLFGFACMCLVLHSLLLRQPYFESSKGTTRADDEPEMLDNEQDKAIAADNEALADEPGLGSPVAGEDPLPKSLSELPRALSAATTDGSFIKTESTFGGNTLKTLREALPFNPTWLTFSDVCYTVKVPGPDGKELIDRPLLRGVSGYAEPGKLTALMGASGAGKTTLLDVLAGRKNMGVIEGKILLNGHVPTPAEFARVTGYVEQFDSLLPYDTVRETLAFAAHLRLPANVSNEIKERIIDEVLDILDLQPIANNLIGSKKIPGLSPSQLKRVNIGCELVANPSVLFLDEPTTGLDSRAAQTVMRVVRRIARSGRSVVCTIHQPSAELFFLFDRLVLLASGGHQMFFGDLGSRSKRFVQYLETVPKVEPIRPRVNPASWMLEQLGVGVSDGKVDAEPTAVIVERVKNHYINSKVYSHAMGKIRAIEALAEGSHAEEHVAMPAAPEVPPQSFDMPADSMLIAVGGASAPTIEMPGAPMQRRSSFSVNSRATHVSAALPTALTAIPDHEKPTLTAQLLIVLYRTWRSYWRNPPMLMTRFKVVTILSVIFGCIYFDLSIDNQSSATSFVAALTVAATFGAVTHATSSLPGKINDRVVFYRETSSGMYAPLLWAVAGLLCDIIWCAPGALLLQIPQYFMVGLQNNAEAFFKYFFAVYLFCVLFTSLAMAIAAVAPDSATANVLIGLSLSFFFTFGGITITFPAVPKGYKWLFRLLPTSHLTEALAMPQFVTCSPMPTCTPLIEVVEGTSTRMEPLGVFVTNYLGFTFDGYWNSLGWATLFMLGVWIVAFIATQKLRFDKR